MKFFRYLVGCPAIALLVLVSLILMLPNWMYMLGLKLYEHMLRLICWVVGKHNYNLYSILLEENVEDLKCTVCQQPVPQESLSELTKKLQDIKSQITFVAQNIQANS